MLFRSGLYALLGIQKGDRERMFEQHGRNYAFFDAPVGLVFTIDRIMRQGSFLDYGMFLENVMVTAMMGVSKGKVTCQNCCQGVAPSMADAS